MKHILFVGGGSWGHIVPLLAVMEAVQAVSDVTCSYAGTKEDVNSEIIKKSPLKFKKYAIKAGKLHRFFTLDQVGQFSRMLIGVWQAYALLRKLRPDCIFCKGSMVSVPISIAANRLHIPLYSHETDVIPGLANRIVSRSARKIFTSYPVKYYSQLSAAKLLYTGQPVPPVFENPDLNKEIQIDKRLLNGHLPILTIIGGSQGARRINQLISEEWTGLAERLQVVHICGSLDYEELKKTASRLSVETRQRLFLTPFLSDELPVVFARSTVVVSRAGGTIATLAICGKATILLPLSTAAQDHQRANARVLEEASAAIVLDEIKISAADLKKEIIELVDNTSKRQDLEKAIRQFARPEAASQIASELLKALS